MLYSKILSNEWIDFLETILKANYYCYPTTDMTSIHLNDAKKECQDNPSCHMFYHVCGRGSKFKFCTDASTESSSACGAVLYKMAKIGNRNELLPL